MSQLLMETFDLFNALNITDRFLLKSTLKKENLRVQSTFMACCLPLKTG
jgi:hypothetical protein